MTLKEMEMPINQSDSTVVYILSAVRRFRFVVMSIVGAACFAGAIYAFAARPVFRATVTVVSAESNDLSMSGGLAALAGQFGGLADLVGLTGSSASLNEALSVLKSRKLSVAFFQRENLLPELFYKRWNGDQNTWKRPSLLSRLSRWINQDELGAGSSEPTFWDAYELFDEIRRVRVDKTLGVTTISVEWRNPELAAKWANDLVKMADDALRDRSIYETKQMIEKLEVQEELTSISDVKKSIFAMAQQELKKSVLANVRESFALKVLDPAVAPKERSWPRRGLILSLSVIAGFFLGVITALFLYRISGQSTR